MLENSEQSVCRIQMGKSGPLERAEWANQIQGFRIPDRWDASGKNKIKITISSLSSPTKIISNLLLIYRVLEKNIFHFTHSSIEEQHCSNIVARYSPLPRYSIPHKIRLLGKWKLQLMIYSHFLSNPHRDLWVCQLFSSQTSCLQKIAASYMFIVIITASEIIALMSLCNLHFYQLSYQDN